MLAAGTISDRARRILSALLTRLGTGEGGWMLAPFIASSDPQSVELMNEHLWTMLLVPSKRNSYLFYVYLC